MDFKEKTDDEILNIATPIMDNLMKVSSNIDYEKHIRDYYNPVREDFTEEGFRKQCEEYQSKWGLFTDKVILGIIRQKDAVNIYWKIHCSKSTDEFLAILSLTIQNSKYVAQRAFIDLWQPKT
ncbi:MAG: hypothetical protein MI976_08530 [Pseudomonadales bacterium]|nr:hypothetical protein [Pseudomonadales bacterium]